MDNKIKINFIMKPKTSKIMKYLKKKKKKYKQFLKNNKLTLKEQARRWNGVINYQVLEPAIVIGLTITLIHETLWFYTKYIEPKTPYEKIFTIIISMLCYGVFQYIIIKVFDSIGKRNKTAQMLKENYKM